VNRYFRQHTQNISL